MIHVHGKSITLNQLKKVKPSIPKTLQTRFDKGYTSGMLWKPIPHHVLAKIIIDEVHRRGWKVLDSRFTLSKDQCDMAAAFDLHVPGVSSRMPKGQSLALGLLTSNAMRRPLKLVVGTTVAVCNNGMATGEILLKKKHTLNLDLAEELPPMLDRYLKKSRAIPKIVAGLKGYKLEPEEADHLILEAGRKDILPWNRISEVDREYRNPTFPEHGRDTSWALLQAFTYCIKATAVMSQMDRMVRFRKMLPTAETVAA